jgi:hypothetical protein
MQRAKLTFICIDVASGGTTGDHSRPAIELF